MNSYINDEHVKNYKMNDLNFQTRVVLRVQFKITFTITCINRRVKRDRRFTAISCICQGEWIHKNDIELLWHYQQLSPHLKRARVLHTQQFQQKVYEPLYFRAPPGPTPIKIMQKSQRASSSKTDFSNLPHPTSMDFLPRSVAYVPAYALTIQMACPFDITKGKKKEKNKRACALSNPFGLVDLFVVSAEFFFFLLFVWYQI